MSNFVKILQENIPDLVAKFGQLVRNGRLSASYIFSGLDEDLKLSAAKYLTAILNCQEDGDYPCGMCSVCQMIEDSRYYGFYILDGQEESASTIKIETVRDMQTKVRHNRPDNWLVIYLPRSQRLTTNAANSLLKILEDTPDRVLFIFSVPTPYFLISTIRSRSQNINMGSMRLANKEEMLFSNITVDNYLHFIENNTISDVLIEIEKSKVNRQDLRSSLNGLLQYLATNKAGHQQIMKLIMKHIKFLDRPVNPQTTLFLLSKELKGQIC